MRIETLAVHAGAAIDDGTRAVTPPIHVSTTYERHQDGTYPRGFNYTRSGNPTRQALETALAALEGGVAAASFASGSAATAAVFQALEPGAHVIAPDDAYYGTPVMLREQFERWGLQTTFVDMTDPGAVKRAMTPSTRLIWIETPSNPRLHVTDIVAMVALAKTIRRAYGRGQHVGHPGVAAAARTRGGLRDALDDEVPQRAFRRAGWRRDRAHHGRRVRTHQVHSSDAGRGAVPV